MQRVDQIVEDNQTVLFRNIAQMRITGRRSGTGVAEQRLDMTEA